MLMAPFSPGRVKDKDGKTHMIRDDVWARAFPNCPHNGKFEDSGSTDDGYMMRVQERMRAGQNKAD
jgi:hypothetical protein